MLKAGLGKNQDLRINIDAELIQQTGQISPAACTVVELHLTPLDLLLEQRNRILQCCCVKVLSLKDNGGAQNQNYSEKTEQERCSQFVSMKCHEVHLAVSPTRRVRGGTECYFPDGCVP